MIDILYDGKKPEQATPDAAGYDLCAPDDFIIWEQEKIVVTCRLRVQIPHGYCGMICSRSGLAAMKGIIVLNAPGIIDNDYRGDIGICLMNLSNTSWSVKKGDRIAQIVFVPVAIVNWKQAKLNETDRGSDGFGSTGR